MKMNNKTNARIKYLENRTLLIKGFDNIFYFDKSRKEYGREYLVYLFLDFFSLIPINLAISTYRYFLTYAARCYHYLSTGVLKIKNCFMMA